ncbi:hypothetical protein RvY_19259 [Ramazzottius varieornatus]|uniref:Uncharacterized protein n=1 Tax=Ramazzottius varieornatus TaxID=947166 RepID=A0A1D1WBS0_RAMVA|nr:hypothetical protein RvY_19259 [Ramazzottius varieornatus]
MGLWQEAAKRIRRRWFADGTLTKRLLGEGQQEVDRLEEAQQAATETSSKFGDPKGKVELVMQSGVTDIEEHDAGVHLAVWPVVRWLCQKILKGFEIDVKVKSYSMRMHLHLSGLKTLV